jgi:putative transposase
MKYRFIKNHESQFPIDKMCLVLKISSSGYYKWKNRDISSKLLKQNQLKEKIKKLYFDFKQRYGSPRITAELNALGY